MAEANTQTLVVRPGFLRVAALSLILVIAAGVFLFLAAVAAMIELDNILGRVALLVLALFMAGLAVYCLLALSTNAVRIEVGPERLRLRMPRARGPLPLPSMIRAELPYSAIRAVECRDEVYNSFGLVTVQRAFSLLTQEGTRLPLGIMTAQWSGQLPYDRAAELIAARAGLSLRDRGGVHAGGMVRSMLYGVPPWGAESMTAVEQTASRGRAAQTMQIVLIVVMAALALRAYLGY